MTQLDEAHEQPQYIDRDSAVEEIISLYNDYGNSDYIGESITQTDHALQSGYHAIRSSQDDTVIIASLLHDIGHLVGLKYNYEMMNNCLGIYKHESIGGNYLRQLHMNNTVCDLVEQHVNAKRYLCYKNLYYYNKLSDASRRTLMYQGGIMSIYEATEFENNQYKDTILLMRTFDEAAKEVDMTVPDIISYIPMIKN